MNSVVSPAGPSHWVISLRPGYQSIGEIRQEFYDVFTVHALKTWNLPGSRLGRMNEGGGHGVGGDCRMMDPQE